MGVGGIKFMNWSKYWDIVCFDVVNSSPSNDSFDNSAVVLNKQADTTEIEALSKREGS